MEGSGCTAAHEGERGRVGARQQCEATAERTGGAARWPRRTGVEAPEPADDVGARSPAAPPHHELLLLLLLRA